MTDAIRDENNVPVALGVSSSDATVTLPFKIDPATGRLITNNASAGASAVTITPGGPFPSSIAATASTAFNSNTVAHWCMLLFPAAITVNKISFLTRSDAIGTASTFDIVVFSEDGQTREIAVTTASITTGNTIYTTAVSAVELSAGNHMVGMIANTDAFDGRFTEGLSPISFTTMLGGVSSEPVLIGSSTETAGTIPATVAPATDITVATSVNNSIPYLRFDN